MSQNQARGEKIEGQYRRTGRLTSHRGFSGGGGGRGGGGTQPPHSSISSAGRSYRKSGNGQSKVTAASAGPGVSSGNHGAESSRGSLQVQAQAPSAAGAKPIDASDQRSARAIPKTPSFQSAVGGSSGSAVPSTPPKGDASRGTVPLQFGSISPGIMNGMQIPARTSSAPPNLDEQKHAQARHDSFRAKTTVPTPPPKQHTGKDVSGLNQSSSGDSHSLAQTKRDVHVPVSSAPSVLPPKSSVLPIGGMPMHMPFQQPQVPLQFGCPIPQMQSQGVTSNSLQMTMALPVLNGPQVPQRMFVPNIQSHPLQPQTMMHQGQNLGFAPQIGHQLPQLGNLGFGIAPQFSQPQPVKFVGPRKTTVKITHPETHEELRLDMRADSHMGSSASSHRPLSNITPQSQPIPTFSSSHQINYYPTPQTNSYNPSMFYSTSSSQLNTSLQGPRYSYPVGQNGQPISFMNPSAPLSGSKSGPPPSLHAVSEAANPEAVPVSAPSAPVQVTIRPVVNSFLEKTVIPLVGQSKLEVSTALKPKADACGFQQKKDGEIYQHPKSVEPPGDTSVAVAYRHSPAAPSALSAPRIPSMAPVGDSASNGAGAESFKEELIQRSGSMMEHQEKSSKREYGQQYNKTDSSRMTISTSKTIKDGSDIIAQETPDGSEKLQSLSGSDSSSSATSLPSPIVKHAIFAESKTSVAVDTIAVPAASSSSGVTLEKEASEDELSSLVLLELATKSHFPEDRDSLEASTSLGSKAGKIISETSDSASSLHESKSFDTEQVQENLTSTEHETAQVSTDSLPHSNLARSNPVLTTAESIEAENIIDVAEQEQIRVENSKEIGACVSYCGEEQTETKREALQCKLDVDGRVKDIGVPSPTVSEFKDVRLSFPSSEERPPYPDAIVNKSEVTYNQVVDESDIGSSLTNLAPVPTVSALETDQKLDGKVAKLSSVEPASVILSGPKDKPTSEPARVKINAGKKKKKKEIFSKADAAGTSDLYNAYKGPEEKQPTVDISESVDSVALDVKHVVADDHKEDARAGEAGQSKAEIDDWEDAADISSPNLRTLENIQQVHGSETSKKRYTRDFLLTISGQCADLPLGFEIGSDIADALMAVPLGASHIFVRESRLSPGRIPDRSPGATRADRRLIGVGDNDKWTKAAGSFSTGHDIRLDMVYGAANISFRPGQGINHAAVRNSRAQSSNHFASGILPGPMQSLSTQGGIPRSNADADRWQRATNIQRGPGLIPSPHGPSQVMHKAAKKYEVGTVSDTEQAKQRQLKAILNKLTPQNFEKLFLQVKEVNIDNTITLTGVISQIFDKALMEPTFCEMYANFCVCLSNELPDFNEDNEKITFRRLLLNKCQEEFERGEREQAEANRAEEEGEIKQTEGERDEKRIKARRRMLGNIRLIGELYKKRMLTERIMHECIKKLLGEYQNPDEEDLEAMCKLMSTIGEMIDHPKAKVPMDAYFDRMLKLSTNQKLSSRVRFMLRDAIDLRKNNWQQRRKVEGPKKIDEVHRDAAQERQAQAGRLARGSVITSGQRRGPPVDYSPRGPALLSSPNSQQIGSVRGLPVQFRGYANQDARMDDRSHFDNRVLSVPLPSITLGPQGGLARGMSIRGQPAMSTVAATDNPLTVGDPRRLASGPNGYSSNSRQDSIPRYMQDKFSGTSYDQRSPQERSTSFGSRDSWIADRVIDRSIATTPPERAHGSSSGTLDVPSESKTLSENTLRDKSKCTIMEFYSAKDEEEVALCIKELNSPSFYPSMISLWVTDSFERKEMERDLLARLLINLCKCQDSLFSQTQLIQGFESVLSSLEDAVNDAPKAAEFLGHLFAKFILEDLVPFGEIGRIVYEGGEEKGSLVESGLASEVLGSILEFIKVKKGDSMVSEIHKSSNLLLEDFLPRNPIKTNKLDAFLER